MRSSTGRVVSRNSSPSAVLADLPLQPQSLFHELADSMAQLVWMADPLGEIGWYNSRWYEYTGTTPEGMAGAGWQSVQDPAVLPQALERWKQSIATDKPFEMRFPLRGADGEFRLFLTRVAPVFDSAGNLIRWFGTNTDVDSEDKIFQELRQSEARLQSALDSSRRLAAIVESSDDAIVSKDLLGIVTSWNGGAEKLFEYTADEMIGKSITLLIPDDLTREEAHFLATIARGDRIGHYETRRRTKSGKSIEVSLTLSPIHDEKGKVVGVAKIARDITRRKQTERALNLSDRLASVGRLAATIAHEINNPLAAITNLVYLAKAKSGEAGTHHLLTLAEEELGRVAQLTKQTLGFFHGTTGVVGQSLAELIEPLVAIYSTQAANKSVRIETEIRQDPTVYCIHGEIRQVVANLLRNSIDAIDRGGAVKIRISAARQPNGPGCVGVRLTVSDSGPGIPLAVRKHLFEPFFTTKKDVGTGLGLWVSSNIVKKHGGTLRLRSSVAPGKTWTAFSFFLPLDATIDEVEACNTPA